VIEDCETEQGATVECRAVRRRGGKRETLGHHAVIELDEIEKNKKEDLGILRRS
jgi:hypothetical protein